MEYSNTNDNINWGEYVSGTVTYPYPTYPNTYPNTYTPPTIYYNWSYNMTEADVDRVAERVIEKLKLELLDHVDPVVLIQAFLTALKDSGSKG